MSDYQDTVNSGWHGVRTRKQRLTYIVTFVPELKNDKIPGCHMYLWGEIWDKKEIANVRGPSWALDQGRLVKHDFDA